MNNLMNNYDIHIILSCLANSIHDIEKYNKEANLGLLKDYKVTYFKLKKLLLFYDSFKYDSFSFEEANNKCGKI